MIKVQMYKFYTQAYRKPFDENGHILGLSGFGYISHRGSAYPFCDDERLRKRGTPHPFKSAFPPWTNLCTPSLV